MFSVHPLPTNTQEFLQMFLPYFPQYTYYQRTNTHQRTYVDEYNLFPTLSWTSYYHSTNPLSLPLYNNQEDNELCQTGLHHLTTEIHEKQFTAIGLTQALNRFVAPKANRFSINHYDHAIARYMEDTFLKNVTNTSPQKTEKFFIKSQYVIVINCMKKKYDNVISTGLCEINFYFEKFNFFSLLFNFLTSKELDLHCSHQIMLRTKQTHTYTNYKIIQHHYTSYTKSRNPQHRFIFLNCKYTSQVFLI